MSIKKRQILTTLNRIIKEELQLGELPSFEKIDKRINDFFKNKTLGLPTMEFRPAKHREISSSEDWNKTIDEIHTDLTVLYEENIDQAERILADFDFFETEKKRLEHKIKSLHDKISELLLLNANIDGYLYSTYDNFSDQSKINMAETNCWIDHNLNQVTPMLNRIGNIKYDLSSKVPKVTLTDREGILREVIESPTINMLDDNLNTSWISKVITSKEVPIEYRIKIPIDVPLVSRLSIDPQVADAVNIQPIITEDGYNWRRLDGKTTQDPVVWDFPEINLKGLEILITKDYPDDNVPGTTAPIEYVYYVGIKNISLFKIGFENHGKLESIPLEVKDRQGKTIPISKVSLEVDEEVPPGTKIDYFIRWDDEDLWIPISPFNTHGGKAPKVIDMKVVSGKMLLNANSQTAELYKTANGLNFYSIGNANSEVEIIKDFNKDIPKLFKGINQWRLERYNYELEEEREPLLSDWTNLPNGVSLSDVFTRYEGVSSKISLGPGGSTPTNSRYTTNIYLSEEREPPVMNLSVPTADQSLFVSVYVNGSKIYSQKITPKITMAASLASVPIPLMKGWNSIQILTYETTPVEKTLNLGLDLKQISSKIRAQVQSMDRVNEFDLLYNVPERDSNSYALSSSNKIIIPEYLVMQQARYLFEFQHYLRHTEEKKIVFKAEMKKEDGVTTPPKLKFYRIRVSP